MDAPGLFLKKSINLGILSLTDMKDSASSWRLAVTVSLISREVGQILQVGRLLGNIFSLLPVTSCLKQATLRDTKTLTDICADPRRSLGIDHC